jgi:hypothetical protein
MNLGVAARRQTAAIFSRSARWRRSPETPVRGGGSWIASPVLPLHIAAMNRNSDGEGFSMGADQRLESRRYPKFVANTPPSRCVNFTHKCVIFTHLEIATPFSTDTEERFE